MAIVDDYAAIAAAAITLRNEGAPRVIASVPHTLSPEATVRLIVYGYARNPIGTLFINSSELIYQVSGEAVEFTSENVAALDAETGEIGTHVVAED